jgi:uncharacterized protein YdeI (YjbR/CyaY-like superfamily)
VSSYTQVQVESRAEWREWLDEHHGTCPGVWLVTFKKKASDGRYVPYEELVEEALCFGWVDSLGRALDDQRTQLLMTPRRPGSSWSRPNKERVTRLLAAGLMAPAGLVAVETARANGAWEALDLVEDLVEPEDLRAALDASPDARREWDAFPRSTRRAILERIGAAKKADTRARRVNETADLAARGIRANQWRAPRRG